jgi:hypothetical protein
MAIPNTLPQEAFFDTRLDETRRKSRYATWVRQTRRMLDGDDGGWKMEWRMADGPSQAEVHVRQPVH